MVHLWKMLSATSHFSKLFRHFGALVSPAHSTYFSWENEIITDKLRQLPYIKYSNNCANDKYDCVREYLHAWKFNGRKSLDIKHKHVYMCRSTLGCSKWRVFEFFLVKAMAVFICGTGLRKASWFIFDPIRINFYESRKYYRSGKSFRQAKNTP